VIKIAEVLPWYPTAFWKQARQLGVRHVVASGSNDPRDQPWWDFMPLARMKKRFEDAGFTVAAIESWPPMDKIWLGIDGRDQQIELFSTLVRNMGALGIPMLCYNFMAVFGWTRTSTLIPSRGGALVTGYDHDVFRNAPLTEHGIVTEDRLWANLEYFLRRVVPVAEKAGVRLAIHPDDPPLPSIRGVSRIIRSVEAFQRVIDLVPSPVNGVALCQGNFTLMTDDLPAVIRKFGRQGKIFFVHFRDVRGTAEKFVETFHDEGQTDLVACMRAYKEVGFEGILRPDHVPTLEGESNDTPSYAHLGRLFAIGYITALREAVYGKQPPEE